MDSEEEKIIAFVFKRSGRERLSFNEFYFTISFDLNWFDPAEAKEFLNNAIKNKLLVKEKDTIKPNIDIEKIEIPLGFRPSRKRKIAEASSKKDVFERIIERIMNRENIDEKTILERVNKIEKEKGLIPEIAALILCKEYNISIEDLFDEVEEKVFS